VTKYARVLPASGSEREKKIKDYCKYASDARRATPIAKKGPGPQLK